MSDLQSETVGGQGLDIKTAPISGCVIYSSFFSLYFELTLVWSHGPNIHLQLEYTI